MKTTPFFEDFLRYYGKALILQQKNLKIHDLSANDPIMDSVTIYDTVNRRFAGFSKALEDIHGKRCRKDLIKYSDFSNKIDDKCFQFLHLFHRFTGSGASFQPMFFPDGSRNPKEHGYHNNIVQDLAECMRLAGEDGIDLAKRFIVKYQKPMVTSSGNQPPSLKNPQPEKYRLAMQYYFDNFAEDFVTDYLKWLKAGETVSIKAAVDFCCAWHKKRGFKQWHFVLTAFVMDTAEYYPELVDPTSHCYYGANCIRGFNLMFEKEKSDPKNRAAYHEKCMTFLCDAVQGRPYDVEDCVCDIIRYWSEYVPKGYDHITLEQRRNNSILKVNGEYPSEIQARIDEILK